MPVRLQRLVELALRHQHVADLVVGDRQITLPLGVAAIGGDEALMYGEALLVALQCLVELALYDLYVADVIVGERQVALPFRVAAIGGRKAPGDGQALTVPCRASSSLPCATSTARARVFRIGES